jgi:hypothetical protein
MKTSFKVLLPLLLVLALPAVVQAQFSFTTNNGTLTLTGYDGPGGAVSIPAAINGLTVTSIGDYAFCACGNLTSVTIGTSVISIGDNAFRECSGLTNITIGYGVTSIGDYAFCACGNLTSVTIPDSVISIGDSAFYWCTSLTSVTIGTNVTTIGVQALSGCSSLTAITVDTRNSVYSDVDGVLFNRSLTTLVTYPGGLPGSYTIPNSVTSIGVAAFQDCIRLTSVTIGTNVTTIGDVAFSDCSSLTSVTIPNSVAIPSIAMWMESCSTGV